MDRLAWCFVVLVGLTSATAAQTHASIEALLDAQRKEFSENCKIIELTDIFIIRTDVNGDGLDDAVLDYGGLNCDGSSMIYCGSAGCSMEIHLQEAGGQFVMVGAVFARGREFDRPNPANPSFLAYMHGNECGRSGIESCVLRFGIKAGELVEMGEEAPPPDE
jgi:hypothetical protein